MPLSDNVDRTLQWPEAIGKTSITLEAGVRFEDPTRPGDYFYGPLEINFWRYPDGGVELQVLG